MKTKKIQSAVIMLCAASAAYAAAGYQNASHPIESLPDRVNAEGHVVRVYDVHRLLNGQSPAPDEPAHQAYIAGLTNSGQNNQQQTQGIPSTLDMEYGYCLRDMVTSNVLGDSWKENGGYVGSIRYAAGMLIVEQTPEGQQKVANFLRLLESGK
jgi:hypothetical protein